MSEKEHLKLFIDEHGSVEIAHVQFASPVLAGDSGKRTVYLKNISDDIIEDVEVDQIVSLQDGNTIYDLEVDELPERLASG